MHLALGFLPLLGIGCTAPWGFPDGGQPSDAGPQDVATTPDVPRLDTATTDSSQDVNVVDDRSDATADTPDVRDTGVVSDANTGRTWCSLGTPVNGANVPSGFCLRKFADVPAARTLVFAPNGDLFVSSPFNGTPGGAGGGLGAIIVLSDDDKDGVGELHTFAEGGVLTSIHGIAIGDGSVFFTTDRTAFRTPYTDGQREETPNMRTNFNAPMRYDSSRWTHGLAYSRNGVLYTSYGEFGQCGGTNMGQILRVLPWGGMTTVATGFRNPMYMRCHPVDELCLAAELGEDQTPSAREKIVVIRSNTDYGYPCCHSTNWPYQTPDPDSCSNVVPEESSFPIGDTPFGLDWERGSWPLPYRNALFVALHGSFYSNPQWQNAGIVFSITNPRTHLPSGFWTPFVTGFGPGGSALERPADVVFSEDGRMFFADDHGEAVYWVAPTTLRIP